MSYAKIIDLARLLNVDYVFMWKYTKEHVRTNNNIRIIHSRINEEDFIREHLFPKSHFILEDIKEKGVLTIIEALDFLEKRGLKMHHSTLWRRLNENKVTSIKVNTACRIPVWFLEKEIEEGKYNFKSRTMKR